MTLFANEREANLSSTLAMIEDVLIDLGHFVNDCRRIREGSAYAWTIHKGSASIHIDLMEHPEFWKIRASSIIMTIHDNLDKAALFGQLLTLNALEVTGAAFALQGNEILLLRERSTLDLERSEVFDLVKVVQDLADEYDNQLVETFGGSLGSLSPSAPPIVFSDS